MEQCSKCGKILTTNEYGLYKRLVGMTREDYLCKKCLALHYKCSEDVLDKKIEQYKKTGCVLFE